jgi:hypothetical protein
MVGARAQSSDRWINEWQSSGRCAEYLDSAAGATALTPDDVQAFAVPAVVERHAAVARFRTRWTAHELVAVLVGCACLVAARRRRVAVAASALSVDALGLSGSRTKVDERAVFELYTLGGTTARWELGRTVLLECIEGSLLRTSVLWCAAVWALFRRDAVLGLPTTGG